MVSRDLWLTHPRVKAAAEKQLGKQERKEPSAYTRLQNAISYSGNWAMDRVHFEPESGRLALTFRGVDLIGTNILLRCHQAKVSKYRKLWANRTASLIIQNQKVIKQWCDQAQYPVRYEAIYITRHRALMDEDNLIGATKVVLDEIVRQTSIPDDTPEFVRHPLVESHKGKIGTLYLALMPIQDVMISPGTQKWLQSAL